MENFLKLIIILLLEGILVYMAYARGMVNGLNVQKKIFHMTGVFSKRAVLDILFTITLSSDEKIEKIKNLLETS